MASVAPPVVDVTAEVPDMITFEPPNWLSAEDPKEGAGPNVAL